MKSNHQFHISHFTFHLLLLASYLLPAQSPPDLDCVLRRVDIDYDILTWVKVPVTCYPFVVYVANTKNGSYIPVDTIDIPDTSRTVDSISNISNTEKWYYLACLNNPGLTSDTVINLGPAAPVIKYVTVTSSGVKIFWTPSFSPETYYYVIQNLGGPRDTAWGRQTDSFLYVNANPDLKDETFVIESFDNCGNPGANSFPEHKTIYLSFTIDSCLQTANLKWKPYVGWTGNINYEIFLSKNGGVPEKVSPVLTDTTSWVFTGVNDNDILCFTIHAISVEGYVSFSNEVCKQVNIAKSAEFVYLRNASVVNENSVQVEWLTDTTAEITSFKILRSTDGINFPELATVPYTYQKLFSYTDAFAATSGTSYAYKVVAVNCNGDKYSENTGKTILLKGTAEINFFNSLSWNAYQQWGSGVSYSVIYRRHDISSWEEVQKIYDTTIVNFRDNVADIESADGVFYYKIISTEGVNTLNQSYGVFDSTKSISNEITVKQPSKVYIPNAFVPASSVSENRIFKPTILFPVNEGYNFLIFDRWGKEIFASNNIESGWDGNIGGEPAPQGVYSYFIEFTPLKGKTLKERGTVVLVR